MLAIYRNYSIHKLDIDIYVDNQNKKDEIR